MIGIKIQLTPRDIEDIRQQAEIIKPCLSTEKQKRVDELIQKILDTGGSTEGELSELFSLLIAEQISERPHKPPLSAFTSTKEETHRDEEWNIVRQAMEKLFQLMLRCLSSQKKQLIPEKKGGIRHGRS